ncbi:MAG: hypothetical protein PUG60_02755 [Lachnospiraceae bacterium]|nr:hypothetical protein [Lachnospiraceae bacterium]
MNRKLVKKVIYFILLVSLIFCFEITAFAEEDDSEPIDIEQSSFTEYDDVFYSVDEFEQYVDGIYNVSENARTNMTGVIRLGKTGSKLFASYSTVYSYPVDKIGVKNIKLQYKGSLGIWHDITTLDNRYSTNASAYQGGFSCTGVIGRVYRLKGTHYVIDGSYTETRNNVTDTITF